MKRDAEALRAWGEDAYRRIPKSVFALVAWHLADCRATDDGGDARAAFMREWETLAAQFDIPAPPKSLPA